MNTKMMKLIASLSLCLSASASAALSTDNSVEKYRFIGDLKYANYCKAILTDDVSMMKKSIRRSVGDIAGNEKRVLRILLSDNGVKCDGESIVEFSVNRKASNIYSYISKI